MRVLVTTASKYGATAELGEAIRDALAAASVDAEYARVEDGPDPGGYDAAVVGSGVYAGHWLAAARKWVSEHAGALGAMPVWLFSSGPVGEPPVPKDETLDLSDIVEAVRPQGQIVLAGKVERSRLKFGDRAITAAMRVPDGDFRDFDAARAWAGEIAAALTDRPLRVRP